MQGPRSESDCPRERSRAQPLGKGVRSDDRQEQSLGGGERATEGFQSKSPDAMGRDPTTPTRGFRAGVSVRSFRTQCVSPMWG